MNYFVNINIIIIMNLEWMHNGFALIYFNNIVNKNEWIELEFGMEVVVLSLYMHVSRLESVRA